MHLHSVVHSVEVKHNKSKNQLNYFITFFGRLFQTLIEIMAILLSLVLASVTMLASAQDFILEGHRRTDWGVWGGMETCSPGAYVYGFRLKVHSDQGFFGDDSALNGIELLCINPTAKRPARNASMTQFTAISSLMGHHGSFTGLLECPDPGFAVGFELRSEEDQGDSDDTTLNNVNMGCCA
ncbi:Vitelline membrane outer layer protein 1 [Folsomia candida]|uniref:Vitelline membrane outer layer protein 1 n=1 Tax=Folsomia candida TaxID=158441 RepID=A0A226CUX8_FOLCA|nr:Vitelline membrane outer layer protein 1 [Folsomia candida]